MQRAYGKVRSEEVVPEMGTALAQASDRMEAEEFVREMGSDPAYVGEGEVGLPRSPLARCWINRFPEVTKLSTLEVVAP